MMLGLSVPAITFWSQTNSLPPNITASSALALAGIGDAGVTEGFAALGDVTGYTATAGRYRLDPTGFVECAANEERLCYNSDGTFRGQYLQGPDTYYSAPWNDPAAPNSSSDPAYFSGGGSGKITYAGDHAEADIFGGTGGGVVLADISWNQFHTASNATVTGVSAGDVLRYQAIVCVEGASAPGSVDIRGAGNVAFAFTFNHDANGEITGHTAAGAANIYRAGYHDLGTINGKRWWHLWVDRRATSTNDAQPGIGFANTAPDTGKTFHVCDLMVQKNPVSAPVAVPVCAANKTFAADTLTTSLTDPIGAVFLGGVARCRSLITDGVIALSADAYLSSDGEPLVTKIVTPASAELADRTGIMPSRNQSLDFLPWGNPAPLDLLLGPARFTQDVVTGFNVATISDLSINSVFQADPLLYGWLDGQIETSPSYFSGDFNTDTLLIFPLTSTLSDQFEQSDFSFSNLHNIDTNAALFSSQNSLWMSHTSTHSRARFQAQADDDYLGRSQVWMGAAKVNARRTGGIAIDISDSMIACIGRGIAPNGNGASVPIALTFDRVYYDRIWSDSIALGAGQISGTANNTFHGRFTAAKSDLYQTRKEIEVDTGSGWQTLSASGLTENDLPVGQTAKHVGVYDFGTTTLDTGAAVPARTTVLRSFNLGSTATATDTPGFQFQLKPRDFGDYDSFHTLGDTFVIAPADGPSADAPHVRVIVDLGSYSGATFTGSANPAALASGTHADSFQPTVSNMTLDNFAADGMVLMGEAQGPFMQGVGTGGSAFYEDIDFTNLIAVSNESQGFVITQTAGTLCDVTLTNGLLLPGVQRGRFSNGTAAQPMGIRAAGTNDRLTLSNVWQGSNATSGPDGESGGIITGTTSKIAVGSVTDYDTFTDPAGTPNITEMFAAEHIEANSKAFDFGTYDPLVDTAPFTASAETLTGMALNTLVQTALATGQTFKPLTEFLMPFQSDPDFIANVAASAAVGDKLDVRAFERFRPESLLTASGPTSTAFKERYGGDGSGYFEFDGDGDLAVARDLTGIDRLFFLATEADEFVLVDVT